MMRKAIFPGTFDPITNGHLDLIERAQNLFEEIIVGVAQDTTGKKPYFSFEKRLEIAKAAVSHCSQVKVKGFSGLLADFYEVEDANVLIRGVRTGTDFDYEFQMAQVNRSLKKDIEILLMMPNPSHLFISGSMVREIARLGGDISLFVPKVVTKAFHQQA